MSSETNNLTQAVIRLLNYSGFKAWRNGNHAVYSPTRKQFMKNPTRLIGVPDIIGYRKTDGKSIYVEIKTGRDKLSPEQIQFIADAKKARCIVLVVENIQQAEDEIKNTDKDDVVRVVMETKSFAERLQEERRIKNKTISPK